ncbi:phage tail protein [Methylosinus sp. Sm6]|uniref:phage tail protein n=1 Tax=Methylosinus sp. Sm6 TaxID=2866948 RepID=UPI001C99A7AA|nr:phage tail protein [Methylosinus sp. Sm6]MBY6239792.1 phage tail protein [Methylosinus sp. Sm6]
MLYQLGIVTFEVTPVNVDSVHRETGHDFASKAIVGALKPREKMGEADDRILLTGTLWPHKFGGIGTLDDLREMARGGELQKLLRGDGVDMGWYLLERMVETHDYLDTAGIGRKIAFNLFLTKSDQRPSQQAALTTIYGLIG